MTAFEFNIQDQALDLLAANETLTITYNVTLTDGAGHTLTRPVVIVANGTNDAPIFTSSDPNVLRLETTDAVGDPPTLIASGSLIFRDVDLNDVASTYTATITGLAVSGATSGLPDNASLKSYLTDLQIIKGAGSIFGHLDGQFAAPDSAFHYLSAGETVTLKYTVQIDDGHGGASDDGTPHTVTITITGSKDAPLISVVGTDSAAKTLTETNAPLSTNGTLTVTDADLSDTVTAVVVTGVTLSGTTGGLTSADVQGMLSVTPGPVDANPGDTHNLTWTFNSDPQAFDFLAADQSLTLTYTVRAADNSSGGPLSDDQTVIITVTGTKGAPVISVVDTDSAAKTLTETNAPLSTNGTLTVTDADLSDTVTAAVVTGVTLSGTTGGLTSADVQGMLSVTPGPVNANPGDTHNLTWTFNSNPQAFDFLAAGQSLTLTYTVRATDNSSGGPLSDDQTVIITITGTEDAPLISVVDTDSAARH